MVVVADATPLHYLVMIDEIDLLRDLYGTVFVPNAVLSELTHPRTPSRVRDWISALPRWASIVPPQSLELPFATLGLGEREAIAIARKAPASILLTDDSKAREAAESVGIQTVPTIRILSTAADLALVDFRDALRRLEQTNFRISRKLISNLLKQQPVE